nr:MAG TPA: hypothetical protein [Caudoviricetes sp.]
MSNSIFQALGGAQQAAPRMPGMAGQFQNMMQKFQQFRTTFQGDPRQEVEKLLQSGRISQQQLNQVQGLAQQFMQFLK